MQTVENYIYKAKVINVKTDSVELEYDLGFYTFHKESINLIDTNFQNRGTLNAGLVIGQSYIFQSFKPESQVQRQDGTTVQLDSSKFNAAIIQNPTAAQLLTVRYNYRAFCIHVHDGDTFKARIDVGFFNTIVMDIRMQGINAPELSTGVPGAESTNYLKAKIENKDIILETFKASEQFEKYGRYLALCYLPENFKPTQSQFSVNNDMIKAGKAIVMPNSSSKPTSYNPITKVWS